MAESHVFSSNGSNGTDGISALQQRLNDPQVAAGLSRLLDRMDSINFAVEAIEGVVSRGDVIVESVTATVKDFKKVDTGGRFTSLLQQAPDLLDTGSRLANVSKKLDLDELEKSHLLERLTDPTTLKTLNELLDKLPLIAFFLESMEGFLQRGDTIIENVAAMVGDLKQSRGDVSFEQIMASLKSIPKLKELSDQLLDSELIGENMDKIINAGVGMVDSGMMDKKVVGTLGDLGKKMVDTYHDVSAQPTQPIGGMWSMLKASRDPDVQKSMGFLFAFAKTFSKYIK